MGLSEQIEGDFLRALKTDRKAVNTLRMLKAELKNRQIELGKELDDSEVAQVVKKEIRKRQEAILDFQRGNREDLAEADRLEIALMKKYLPPEISQAELEKIVSTKMDELKITDAGQFGRLMGAVMKEAGQRADGNVVKKIIQDMLNHKFTSL